MTDIVSAQLGGITLGGVDGFGTTLTLALEDGFLGSPAMRLARVDWPSQAGSFPTAGVLESRTIVLTGLGLATTTAGAIASARALDAILAGGGTGPLVWVDPAGTLQMMVQRDGPVRIRITAPTIFEWQLALWAADPIKYGLGASAIATLTGAGGGTGRVWPRVWPLGWGGVVGINSGSVSVRNAGTVTYWPVVRITGPAVNPTITLNETGDFVRLAYTVPAGQWVDIDLGTRRVLLNGQVSLRYLATYGGNWLAVPVGGGTVSWTADVADPAALLTVNFYEGAWS